MPRSSISTGTTRAGRAVSSRSRATIAPYPKLRRRFLPTTSGASGTKASRPRPTSMIPMAISWRRPAARGTAAASGSVWEISPAGIPSWTRTVTWSASGTSSFPPNLVCSEAADRLAALYHRDATTITMKLNQQTVSWLQVAPLTVVLLVFFGIPMLMVAAVSFFDYERWQIVPAFILDNYVELFQSSLTLRLYLTAIKYVVIVWAITLLIGFTVAYFLVFHVRSLTLKMGLFLLCTVPFWTSNIIRMISWIPFLGRNGVFNTGLETLGIINQPLSFLLFSDFAVIVAYVHLNTLFMIVPIFNSMARIDTGLIEAAHDAGASRWRVIWEVVLPLSKTGIALGSIFVITLVMGDFFVVKIMSGGQSATVVSALATEISSLQYPPAAASAVALVVIVALMVSAILRLVDVRRELTG